MSWIYQLKGLLASELPEKNVSKMAQFECRYTSSVGTSRGKLYIREFKIRRLRTTTTVKHATAHDQNHVTVYFFRVVLRLR